jgi:hypothetical protein
MLGHFTQADSIIPEPGKSQSFDRYTYVANNPVKLTDPTGYRTCDEVDKNSKCITIPDKYLKTPPPKESKELKSMSYDGRETAC